MTTDRERPVTVLGGGRFGRALASAVHRAGRRALLVSRSGIDIGGPPPEGVEAVGELARAVAESNLVLIAVGSDRMVEMARELGAVCSGRHSLVHGLRGLVTHDHGETLEPASVVLRRETDVRRVGVLAGPLVATSVLAGRPGGCIVASRYDECIAEVRAALTGPMLRVYRTDDCVGVEVAAALVGTLAMAAGFALGAGFGPSATAVLVTRGMRDAGHVGRLFGAHPETFTGLAGFGDLVAAMADEERPEVRLGRLVAEGRSWHDAIRQVGRVGVELTMLAPRIVALAKRSKVDVPVLEAIAGVLSGAFDTPAALRSLMERDLS
ncbi:MAG: glycerol-3-phosphate dehydrogenase [Deltaproteobacteria bacterium]|nr:glycerol-3-phosphate dehydrogenase [Deltaproteobacteria bacterium]